MHNGTIMQFFMCCCWNSILWNPYSDYLEIFWFNVFDNQKMQDIARIWVYLTKNKHKQSWQMSDTRLSQVLDKNLFLQCQILLPHLDKQVDRQEARQFFWPKSGGAFNKVVPDVELLNWKNAKFFFLFLFLTEEIQYHDGLRSRELGQAPILLCGPNS